MGCYVTGRLHPTIKIVTTELRAVLWIPIRPEQNFAGSGAQITNQDSDLLYTKFSEVKEIGA